MSAIVKPEMVKIFTIEGCYQPGQPCHHHCWVKLLNGRSFSAKYSKAEIAVLIDQIAKEKIESNFNQEHFDEKETQQKSPIKSKEANYLYAQELLTEKFLESNHDQNMRNVRAIFAKRETL